MATKRADPEPAPYDADDKFLQIVNPIPGHHYVMVNPLGNHHMVERYEMFGYRAVCYEDGGTRLIWDTPERVKKKLGKEIAYCGAVLMSCDEDNYRKIYERGQKRADDVDRKILSRQGGYEDPVKARGLYYYNETSDRQAGV